MTVSADEAHRGGTLAQAVIIDGPALFLQGAILLMAALGVLTMAEKFGGQGADAFTPMGAAVPGSPHEAAALRAGLATSEVFPLTLFSVVGMLLFPAAGDLLTMFVALEVLSLPLYLLCGLARRRRLLSQEASLKYFLLGAFSSAFFLFGAALLYGYAGSLYLADIATAVRAANGALEGLLLPGVVLVLVGLLFKVGAVPFHSWTPDVYQGAPTPVTGFMAACTKVAAFGAILRVVYVGVEANRWDWRGGVIAVAALTMVVGAVLSVTQTDVKRLLAYSSIAHAGFILVAVLAFDRTGVSGTMFYLVAYGFTTIAGFAVVSLVRQGGSEASHLSQWAGSGPQPPGRGRRLRVPAAGLRGHPADVRLRREVCRVRAGHLVRWAVRGGPGHHRRALQRHHRLRLRPADRADVLHRAAGRRGRRGGDGIAVHHGRHHHRHPRDAGPRHRCRAQVLDLAERSSQFLVK